MLEGKEFSILTDHKSLNHALFRSSPPWSARQQRYLSYLAEFTSSIFPGKENVVPYALSRPNPAPISPEKSALLLTTGRATASTMVPLAEPVISGFDVANYKQLAHMSKK